MPANERKTLFDIAANVRKQRQRRLLQKPVIPTAGPGKETELRPDNSSGISEGAAIVHKTLDKIINIGGIFNPKTAKTVATIPGRLKPSFGMDKLNEIIGGQRSGTSIIGQGPLRAPRGKIKANELPSAVRETSKREIKRAEDTIDDLARSAAERRKIKSLAGTKEQVSSLKKIAKSDVSMSKEIAKNAIKALGRAEANVLFKKKNRLKRAARN